MNRQDQRPAPTVGDTLTIVQRVAAPIGALVQPRGLTDSSLATLVGIPEVRREGDSVRIAYAIAVWAPGRHELTIPGAIVVDGSGRVDTLPDATVRLQVGSVLPERTATESIAPQAARPWLARTSASPIPFIALLVPLALLVAALAVWWRRRGPAPAAAAVMAGPTASTTAVRIARWIEAGEVTLAIDHLVAVLPDAAETRAWREQARSRRYDPGARDELARIARAGLALLDPSARP